MKALTVHTLLVATLVSVALSAELDPKYSFADFLKQFNKTYEERQRAQHEVAFQKNYAILLKLKSEGHDVVVTERLDWTEDQFGGTFVFTFRADRYQTVKNEYGYFKWTTESQHFIRFPELIRLEDL